MLMEDLRIYFTKTMEMVDTVPAHEIVGAGV
jgi:hypothetical protein